MSAEASAFRALSLAMVKGFWRDKSSVFFAVIFPLMFLVLFGAIFDVDERSPSEVVQVGAVPLIDDLPKEARSTFDDAFDVSRTDDREAALAKVRKGDVDAVIEMRGDTLVAHYTVTDQTSAAMTAGTLQAFVDSANVSASGKPPTYRFEAESVEDESLQAIDLMTPGLLGWAVAMSAAIGAAATLQGWRQSKLLRRLQLAPVRPRTIVGARIFVTVMIAFAQTAIFLGLGTLGFGLNLTGSWWMAVPLVVAGTLCFMALGLLAGALAKSTEGAVNLANLFVLPMAFLSGSFFPLDDAPGWLQAISKSLPLRHLNDGMLDVMIRGEGAAAALLPIGILLAFAAVVCLVAAKLFRWESA